MNHFAAIAAANLFAAIWQGAILAAVVALALRLLSGIGSATRSLIWTVTFALLIGLHLLPAVHPVAVGPAHPLQLAPMWSVALMVLWLAVSLFRAAEFILSAHRLRQVDRRAVPVGVDLAGMFEGARAYTLCTSGDVDRPSVLGFFRPRILLPQGLLETLSTAELRQILIHETEHLRRSDDWTNLLQKLALVVFPLNPVLFWVERRLCLERELACDARVLAAGENLRKAYATTLTRLAEHSILGRGMNLALGFLGQRPRQSELSTRVHRILARPTKNLTRTQSRVASAAVLGSLLALSTTLAHVPRLVSFGPESASRQIAAVGVSGLASGPSTAKLVEAKALVQPSRHPAYRTIEAVARVPVNLRRRSRKLRRSNEASGDMDATFREPSFVQQPRMTLLTMRSGTEVRQFVVPAVADVPAGYVPVRFAPAYAAIRTADGWIVFQL